MSLGMILKQGEIFVVIIIILSVLKWGRSTQRKVVSHLLETILNDRTLCSGLLRLSSRKAGRSTASKETSLSLTREHKEAIEIIESGKES